MKTLNEGDRIRLNVNGSFELPRVVSLDNDSVVVQRRRKGREIGKVTLPRYRVEELPKSFRSANFECTVHSKL